VLLRPRRGRAAVPIHVRTWELSGAKGIILLVHGLNGHSLHRSNLWTAHSLLNAGFTVVALDIEGHGRSGGVRGLLPGLETDVAGDLAALLALLRRRYAAAPLFLMGTSMGGLSAALTALSVQHAGPAAALLSGVVLQCPLIRTAAQPGRLTQLLARALSLVAPGLPLLSHKAGAGAAPGSAVEAAVERSKMLADGLCYTGAMRIGTGLALLRGAAHLAGRLSELRLPLLLQHGSADALVAPRGSAELLQAAASGDKTLIVYDGASHNLLAEAPATLHAVRQDYLAWLDARLDASAASAAL
jgi:alpha-beta hydrolase superfamily lysophospholipase